MKSMVSMRGFSWLSWHGGEPDLHPQAARGRVQEGHLRRVAFGDALHDGQAQTRPVLIAAGDAEEALAKKGKEGVGDTGTVVLHGKHELIHEAAEQHRDGAAPAGVMEGVVDEVVDDFLDLECVA